MEVGNYTVEPSSIFMGRGSHPMRGCWKEGSREEDVELNLSPDAPRPPATWKAIVWEPDNMWIARWRDKLSDKMKYVWLSDSSILKQRKEIEKFEKAKELRLSLTKIQQHIIDNLDAEDLRRRKTATVCYLIDRLKFRVGDEKDEDEADTVGASTLRPEHISFNGDGSVTFDFLGKDSVRHVIRTELPDQVVRNLKEFSAQTASTLFDEVDSKRVSDFLDEVYVGLSAKVFRTYYSSEAVETKLKETLVDAGDAEYVKKHAAVMANLEAARVCNHKRTIPKTWESSLAKKKERLKALRIRARDNLKNLNIKAEKQEQNYNERLAKQQENLKQEKAKLQAYRRQLDKKKEEGRSVKGLERRISSKREAIARINKRIRDMKAKHKGQMKKHLKSLENRKNRDNASIEKLKLQIEAQQETRDYNLGTSLKSYIDPRIYYDWGRQVDYDWKKYYPKTLHKKFSWVESDIDDKQMK